MEPKYSSASSSRSDSNSEKITTTPSINSKVCLICSGYFIYRDTAHENAYLIYVIDFKEKKSPSASSDNEFIPKQPTIILGRGEALSTYALCVKGCKLFVFESCRTDYESYISLRDDYEGRSSFKPTKAAYTFDFSQICDKSNIRLSKNMMLSIPDMPYSIYSPVAIPTPDSENILVFSESFGPVLYEDIEIIDFMLYNPSTSSWTSLPGIRHLIEHCHMSHICIDAYAFLSPHTFFLKTGPGQMFTLDLLSLSKEDNDWQPFQSSILVENWGRFHVIQDTWFTCDFIFHAPRIGPKLNRGKWTCPACRLGYCDHSYDAGSDNDSDSDSNALYFELSYPGFDGLRRSYPITALVDSGFCIVRTLIERQSEFPHIIVDVFDIDGGVSQDPFTTLNFIYNESYNFFLPIGLFTM